MPRFAGLTVSKEIGEVLAWAEEQHWSVERHGQQRIKVLGPNGEGPVIQGVNDKDSHTAANFRSELRRAGCGISVPEPEAVESDEHHHVPPMEEFLGAVGTALTNYQERIESDGGWQQIAEEQERVVIAQKTIIVDLEHDLEVVSRQKNEAQAETRRLSQQLSVALRAQHEAEGKVSAYEQGLRGLLQPTG